MWEKTYLSISERFCILGQKTQSFGQDFVAARCLPVRDIKGTECKTVVAGCRSIDNAELQPLPPCLPNPSQNALREHQLAQPGYSASRRFKEQASIGLAHVQGHGRPADAFYRMASIQQNVVKLSYGTN